MNIMRAKEHTDHLCAPHFIYPRSSRITPSAASIAAVREEVRRSVRAMISSCSSGVLRTCSTLGSCVRSVLWRSRRTLTKQPWLGTAPRLTLAVNGYLTMEPFVKQNGGPKGKRLAKPVCGKRFSKKNVPSL